jgi:hypothetical protein
LNESFNVFSHGGLVVFDGWQKIGAVFEHQLARGLILGVPRVQARFTTLQFELLEEFTRDGDCMGLGVHEGAAQEVLAGRGERGEHGMAAAGVGPRSTAAVKVSG